MLNFRDYEKEDRETVMAMCREFYSGDAVDHPVPMEYLEVTFDEIVKGSPYLRGILFEYEGKPAGYGQLSFTFSSEAGGFTVLVEEVFVSPAFQGKGIGSAYLEWLFEEYRGKAKRFRLEVCEGNAGAIRLYEKKGFTLLPYKQMILEK